MTINIILKMKFELGSFKKVELQINENKDSWDLARVTWVFADGKIRGGRITKSKFQDCWVQMPKFKAKNHKYINIIQIPEHLEDFLLDKAEEAYYKATQISKDVEEVFGKS